MSVVFRSITRTFCRRSPTAIRGDKARGGDEEEGEEEGEKEEEEEEEGGGQASPKEPSPDDPISPPNGPNGSNDRCISKQWTAFVASPAMVCNSSSPSGLDASHTRIDASHPPLMIRRSSVHPSPLPAVNPLPSTIEIDSASPTTPRVPLPPPPLLVSPPPPSPPPPPRALPLPCAPPRCPPHIVRQETHPVCPRNVRRQLPLAISHTCFGGHGRRRRVLHRNSSIFLANYLQFSSLCFLLFVPCAELYSNT